MSFAGNLGGSVTDVFYSQYLDQVQQVRNQVLGGGPLLDEQTQEYYLKVQTRALLFIGLEDVHKVVSDKKTDKYYKDPSALHTVAKASQEGVQAQQAAADKLGSDNLKYYSSLDALSAKTADNAQLSEADPIPTESVTNPDFTNQGQVPSVSVPDSITQLYDQNTTDGDKARKYFEDHDKNNFKNTALPATASIFPTPGEDVQGHDGIGEIAGSSLTYDIGGTPNEPARKQYKSWARVPKGVINQTATPLSPLTERIAEMLDQQRKSLPGSYRFFIEKLHGKSLDGNFYKKNVIKSGLTARDLPNRMVFPAYVSKFNDSYDLGWDQYNFIGRGEPSYIYKETTRSLTIEFNIVSDFSSTLLVNAIQSATAAKGKQSNKPGNNNTNKNNTHNPNQQVVQNLKDQDPISSQDVSLDEEERLKAFQSTFIDWGDGSTPNPSILRGQLNGFVGGQTTGTPEMLYERMTFLAQCCYGWYRKDGKLKEQPFVRIRLGDFFDVVAKVNSLNMTEDEFGLDLNPSTVGAIPSIVTVSMNLTIIHEDEPTSEYRRFYHRRDYDKNPLGYVPPSGQETSNFKDSTLDNNQSKSPISFSDTLSDHGKDAFSTFPAAALAQQASLQQFNGAVSGIQQAAQSLNSVGIKEKLKNMLSNAKSLLEVAALSLLNEVKDPKAFIPPVVDQAAKQAQEASSLANTPVANAFDSAKIPKIPDIPVKSTAMFPKFKNPNN